MSEGRGGQSLMPGATFVVLQPGQAVIWNGDMLHRGRTEKGVERLTLSCSWSRWNGCNVPPPPVIDSTVRWKLDSVVRDALPTAWMKLSWDRWLLTQYGPEQIIEKYPGLLPSKASTFLPCDALSSWQDLL